MMLTLGKQSAEVRELSARASLAAQQMQHSAESGKRSLVEAAKQPAAIVAGAAVVGAVVWLWPRGGARSAAAARSGSATLLRRASTAIHVGTLAWRFAQPFLQSDQSPGPRQQNSRSGGLEERTQPRAAAAPAPPSTRSQTG